MENVQHDTDDDEHVEVRAGGKKGKAAADVPQPDKVKQHTAVRGEGVLPSKRGVALEGAGQVSAGKRSRTDPVAARKRFNFYFSVLLCLFSLHRLILFFCTCFCQVRQRVCFLTIATFFSLQLIHAASRPLVDEQL